MQTLEEIMSDMERDISADIHGDIYGHERYAEEIFRLRADLYIMKARLSRIKEDAMRDYRGA
jgi:hypothetical protein